MSRKVLERTNEICSCPLDIELIQYGRCIGKKVHWFATQTGKQWKTMVNNELPLFKRTNQETRKDEAERINTM